MKDRCIQITRISVGWIDGIIQDEHTKIVFSNSYFDNFLDDFMLAVLTVLSEYPSDYHKETLRATPHNCEVKKASSEEDATMKTYRSILIAGRTESSLNRKPVGQIQIRQCEHDIQFGGLFSQTSISCFAISEQSFYNGKYMLNFAAYR